MKTWKKVLLAILIVIVAAVVTVSAINRSCVNNLMDFVGDLSPVDYESQLEPQLDENGNYSFSCDREFKVMQLTDIHLGCGFLSKNADIKALNAVSAMVSEEKPDFVVVTGDIAFPVPYISGTLNNRNSAVVFAELMEQLGVYWAPALGNHDSEIYSFTSREKVAALYESEEYPHCLFQAGPEDVDGYGNYLININNSKGESFQQLYVFDSHAYTDGDLIGIQMKFDCIHENQIEWYENQLALAAETNGGKPPKSLVFFHIPPVEMRDSYTEYIANNCNDTENISYVCGEIAELEPYVLSSKYNNGLIDSFINGGSTQGVFFGHDHVNTICLNYKGLNLTYGCSIDYLAYPDIANFGFQRGCNMITINQDGSYTHQLENYYQDKYVPVMAKEAVSMDIFHPVVG